MRHDEREPDQLRPITVTRFFTGAVPGSVLIKAGRTTVLCTASIEDDLPPWMKREPNPKGWVTAEYNMLPASTSPRKPRERSKIDGRTNEIQRLIGRSLRAVVDLAALGPRMITIDCDVLEADGGTRTAAINGAFVALCLALHKHTLEIPPGVVTDSVAAISVGLLDGAERLDLEYVEDRDADVDMNLVMTGSGRFIEVQGAGEEATFATEQLYRLIELGRAGTAEVTRLQRAALGSAWPGPIG